MAIHKKPVATDGAPRAVGSYSQAVLSGDLLFLSGQIALDPKSAVLVGDDAPAQAHRVMRNLGAVLERAGADFGNLLKVTIYLVDLADFQAVDAVYSGYLKPPYPARATVGVAALPKGALVEMEAVARIE